VPGHIFIQLTGRTGFKISLLVSAHDYMPDEDNAGMVNTACRKCLMQTDEAKIMLLPACPKEWDTGL